MAGRTRRPQKPANQTAEADEPEVTEAPVEGTEETQEEATEAPEITEEADVATVAEDTEQTEEAQAEAPAEAQEAAPAAPAENKTPDDFFKEFQAVVNEAVEKSDPTTATVPDGELAKSLDAYRALPNTAKKSDAKAWLADIMRETLMNKDMAKATAYATINKAVNEVGTRRAAASPAKPQVSVTEGYVNRIVSLALANQFTDVPEGLDENWQDQYNQIHDENSQKVGEYKAYLKAHAEWAAKSEEERGDEPQEPEGISQVLKDAAKIGQGKAVGGRRATGARRTSGGGGGARRDVAKHIQEFLASVPDGSEHAVAAIANFKSSEYPEGDASPGAVAVRLFPDGKPSTVPGFEPVVGSTPRKIRKLATA